MISAIILAICVAGTFVELGLNLLASISSLNVNEVEKKGSHANGSLQQQNYDILLFQQVAHTKSKL